ncbi:MAG: hypothetical protein OER85_08180 [Gammaproteobacteria bacterium]|nr:hypothetical protein [Gammaproteobacteria bacterium]
MIRKTLSLFLALALPLLAAGTATAKPDGVSAGRDQLIRAFDAAWVRVLRSGKYRDIINSFDEPIPGVIDATDYIINQSDCLPNPDVTPFPKANGVKGMFKRILEDREIIRGEVLGSAGANPGGTTADWFSAGDPNGPGNSDISAEILKAILAEIAAFYGTGPIAVTSIEIPFPFNTTSALQDGIFGTNLNFSSPNYFPFQFVNLPGVTVDFLDQFNAKGGETEEYRRLTSRRSTCTFTSSGQFIHIPAASPLAASIQSIDDLRANPSVEICTGNLSTQLSNQYFPDNPVFTSRGQDIVECYQRLLDGDSDILINSLPVLPTPAQLGVPGPAMAPAVNTFIVAGTPYWVREDDVTCEPVFVPGPFEFGTFRECREGK